MKNQKISGMPFYQFDILSDFSHVKHYVSGRAGGVSGNEFSSLNLSLTVGDDPDKVRKNRLLVQDSIAAGKIVFPNQTHSSNVVVIRSGEEDLNNTDALITNTPGICISVMGADCVPVLIYDPVKKAVAAIHSGWRGTVAGISTKAVDVLRKEYGSSPADLVACIGPSISSAVYEVGEEVITVMKKVFAAESGVVVNEKNGKGFLDLWKANEILLKDTGIKGDNIEVAGICTYQNYSQFFSARRAGNKTGRFAAGIMLY